MTESEETTLLTLLPAGAVADLERAAPQGVLPVHASDATQFARLLRSQEWRSLVVDPTALGEDALSHVAIRAREGGQRLVLFAPTTAHAAQGIVAAARHANVHVVLADCESTERLLALELKRVDGASARAPLLTRVNDAVGVLPPSLCAAAVSLFGVLPLPESCDALARRAGCSRRSVDRWARRAGFRGAASLLRAVRLAWAWEMSQASERDTWRDVSDECGYGSTRTLRAHSRRILGVAPGRLAETAFDAALVARLAKSAVGPRT